MGAATAPKPQEESETEADARSSMPAGVSDVSEPRNPDRFYCPFPGCNRSFVELWRLKVHHRAPPDVRGSGKERGHGRELDICPKCFEQLRPGRHHVGCLAGRVAKPGNKRQLPQDDSVRCSRMTPGAGRPAGQKPSNNHAEVASSNMLAAEQQPSQLPHMNQNQQAHVQQHQQGAAHMVRAGSTTDTHAQASGSKPSGGHLRFETGTRTCVDMSSSSLSSMTMMQGGMPGASHNFMPMHGIPAGPICFGDAPYSMYSHPMQWLAADPGWQASGFSNAFQNDLKWDTGGGMQGQPLDMAGMDGKPVGMASGGGLPELSFPPFFPCASTRGDGTEGSGALHPSVAMTLSNSQKAAESDSPSKGAGTTPPQFNPRFVPGGSTGSTGEDDDSLLLRLINSSGENGSRLVSVSPQQQQQQQQQEATRQPGKQ